MYFEKASFFINKKWIERMNFSVALGRRVKELRKKASLSQDQAAERAGISGKYLGQVERGEVKVLF